MLVMVCKLPKLGAAGRITEGGWVMWEEHTGITCSVCFGEARLHATTESVVTGSTPDPVTEQLIQNGKGESKVQCHKLMIVQRTIKFFDPHH